MSTDTKTLKGRAAQLLALAREEGFNSIEGEVALLPDGDHAAQIGYLANLLGIDPGLAFDIEADIERRAD